MFGEIKHEENRKVKDLGAREVLILCCVVFFIILMGVYPKMFLKKMDTSVQGFLAFVKERNAYYSTMDGQTAAGRGGRSCPAQAADRGYEDEHNAVPFRFRMDPAGDNGSRLRAPRSPCGRSAHGKAAAGWAVCSPLSGLPSPSISRCTSGPCGRTFSTASTSSTSSAPSLRPYSS